MIVAHELGMFADAGLSVRLERQIGWGNVRDKLMFGQLDAAHALLGLPVTSAIHAATPPIVGVMSLGTGGDAITLGKRLVEAGVRSASTLAAHLRADRFRHRPLLGHVFGSSAHHYLLREWLDRAELSPDEHVRLAVVPPPQVPEHLADGSLDGFCVGEPWNTVAERAGHGRIVSLTTDVLPAHPDKVFAVRQGLLDTDRPAVVSLIGALLRACRFCADAANAADLARLLSGPAYLDLDPETVAASLAVDRQYALRPRVESFRAASWHMRSFAPASTFPNQGFATWLLEQMVRWGHADAGADAQAVARRSLVTAPYREAAAAVGVECPARDLIPLAHARPLNTSRTGVRSLAAPMEHA